MDLEITYDAAGRGAEMVALGEWLVELNLNPQTILRVVVDPARKVVTIHQKHGGQSSFPIKRLPPFIIYRIEGLAPCGHHTEDSFGAQHCLACKANRTPWDGKGNL